MRKIRLRIAVLLCLLAVFVFSWVAKDLLHSLSVPTRKEEEGFVDFDTVVRREIYYAACRHLDVHSAAGQEEFSGKSFGEITQEGWHIIWAEDGSAVAFRESALLCPEDDRKTHLAIYQDKLALFHGPIGTEGEPLEVIYVKPESLPALWRQKLINNGGIEFQTRDELLSALESLDELKER
ncbi:MAG: hypothetical protein FWD39_01450 [Clostridiales bacterium]|nr:hypothetical protein [Clostridiales bacterium]